MNNNEGKNNSQGIFYAVIGVATLVVTIVGATFAFFSATANSPVNAVATNSATVDLTFTPVATGVKGALIPVNEALPRFASVVGTAETDCKDDNGNNICSVYQFTITNPSQTASQRIYVSLTPNVNEFINLKYAVFKGADSDIKGKDGVQYDVDGTAVTTSPITLAPLEQVLSANSSVTYTIVLWLHETGNVQSDATVARCATGTGEKANHTNESGANFGATVNVTTSSDGTGGVTGVLAVQGNG